MGELPAGANLLSQTQISDDWLDRRSVWIRSGIYGIICALSTYGISLLVNNSAINLFTAFAALIIINRTANMLNKSQELLEMIAISSGHPWHESVSTDDTSVFVRSENEWVALTPDVRLFATDDPLLNRSLLRDGDADGDVLIRWPGQIDSRVVALINMAQALATAQNRDEGAEDDFESARERENTAEGVLEREWLDTEGALEYEPGALLRKFKQSMNGDDGGKRES
ncbi:MAG: hypothetical protein CMJ72_03570 [Planctomycetaceae bacterium]|nr:hypothetical protein [Planctomycetaceae bacterium]